MKLVGQRAGAFGMPYFPALQCIPPAGTNQFPLRQPHQLMWYMTWTSANQIRTKRCFSAIITHIFFVSDVEQFSYLKEAFSIYLSMNCLNSLLIWETDEWSFRKITFRIRCILRKLALFGMEEHISCFVMSLFGFACNIYCWRNFLSGFLWEKSYQSFLSRHLNLVPRLEMSFLLPRDYNSLMLLLYFGVSVFTFYRRCEVWF